MNKSFDLIDIKKEMESVDIDKRAIIEKAESLIKEIKIRFTRAGDKFLNILPLVKKAAEMQVTNAEEFKAADEAHGKLHDTEKSILDDCDPVCDLGNKIHKASTSRRGAMT